MIGRGAEAIVERDGDAVEKRRPAKGYRHPELDRRLREDRTDLEARLLERAEQAGVRTPEVLAVTEDTIRMAYVAGPKLRDVLEEDEQYWTALGEVLARLHDRNIVHGDMTTSNIIVRDGELVVIDFGLGMFSDRIEDHATELKLVRQMLEASHNAVWEEVFDAVLAAYREQSEDGAETLQRLEEAEARGRYR